MFYLTSSTLKKKGKSLEPVDGALLHLQNMLNVSKQDLDLDQNTIEQIPGSRYDLLRTTISLRSDIYFGLIGTGGEEYVLVQKSKLYLT
jgi:hypothetical protein